MPFIAFRNFGPIAHAEVDLKPLTILIGSNNTGKSYLALAIRTIAGNFRNSTSGVWAHAFKRMAKTRAAGQELGSTLDKVVRRLDEL